MNIWFHTQAKKWKEADEVVELISRQKNKLCIVLFFM